MTKPVTHDIPRLRRLLAMIETSILAPVDLFNELRTQEGATIGAHGDGTFRIRLAGVKVQTTAGQINALLMWQGKARAIVDEAAPEPSYVRQQVAEKAGVSAQNWLADAIAEAQLNGCTFHRATISEDGKLWLVEGWQARPHDQGEPRWMYKAQLMGGA